MKLQSLAFQSSVIISGSYSQMELEFAHLQYVSSSKLLFLFTPENILTWERVTNTAIDPLSFLYWASIVLVIEFEWVSGTAGSIAWADGFRTVEVIPWSHGATASVHKELIKVVREIYSKGSRNNCHRWRTSWNDVYSQQNSVHDIKST